MRDRWRSYILFDAGKSVNERDLARGSPRAYLALIAVHQDRMARCIPQHHLHFRDLVQRIDALRRFMGDDGDAKMCDPICLDVVGAFQSVGLFNESAATAVSLALLLERRLSVHDGPQAQ